MSDKIIISPSTHSERKGGFSSPNFPHDRAQEMRRKGGKRRGAKGFALLTPEERKKIASMGGKAGGKYRRKYFPKNPFDVI